MSLTYDIKVNAAIKPQAHLCNNLDNRCFNKDCKKCTEFIPTEWKTKVYINGHWYEPENVGITFRNWEN